MQKHEDKNTAKNADKPNDPGQPTTPGTNDKKGGHMPTDKTTEHKEKPGTTNTKAEIKEQPEGKRSK